MDADSSVSADRVLVALSALPPAACPPATCDTGRAAAGRPGSFKNGSGRRRAGRFVQSGRTTFFPVPVLRLHYGKNGYVLPGSGPTDLHYMKNGYVLSIPAGPKN